ncbi:MAG: hypothetical protein HRT99_03460 [Mycoplasmatales bacterium]|nr:hypothetical protein [Mycoplasmatales bacterium]
MMLGIISGPIFLSKNQRLIKGIIPWMLMGGFFTILLGHPPFTDENISTGVISYIKHLTLFIAGLIGLFINKYDKKDYYFIYGIAFLFIAWVLLTSGVAYKVTGKTKYAVWSTALLEPSYRKTSFKLGGKIIHASDYEIMGKSGIPFPIPSIIFYLIVFSLIFFSVSFSRKIYTSKVIIINNYNQ